MYSGAHCACRTDYVVARIRVRADGFFSTWNEQTIWILRVAALELWTADTVTRICLLYTSLLTVSTVDSVAETVQWYTVRKRWTDSVLSVLTLVTCLT